MPCTVLQWMTHSDMKQISLFYSRLLFTRLQHGQILRSPMQIIDPFFLYTQAHAVITRASAALCVFTRGFSPGTPYFHPP